MQGSNSIWKLTALAGVVGLGLLGILQFQRTMDRKSPKNAEAKVRLQDFKKQSELGDADPKADDLDMLQSNVEPRRLGKQNARKLDALENVIDATGLDELPLKKTKGLDRTSAGFASQRNLQTVDDGDSPRIQVTYSGSDSDELDKARYSRVPVLDRSEEEFAAEKPQP